MFKRDNAGHVQRTTLRRDGSVIDRTDYSFDDLGRVDNFVRQDALRNRAFHYDAMGRLVSEIHGDGTADRTTTVGYSYDAVGNRLTRTAGTKTRNYNYAPDSNRLTARGRDQMVHDARGNLREDRQGRRAFDYDPTNRMVAFHRDGELRSEYDYDMEGRRIRKRLHRPDADGVRSVRFVYDTEGRLVSETRRRDDRSAVKARDIVWLGSLPLAQIERRVRGDGTTRSADVLSLHPGHLGEPREARDASGTVVWRWDGDAFGANMGGTPAVNRDPDGDGIKTEVSLRFPGQYHDRESGLFYNHHRDYDPKLGRYIQSDPIGLLGGVNRYAYVGGDPVNWVDPLGLARDTGRCTGSRTCSGLARTFVYSGNITDCYVWDTYTNGTYTGTSPGGCNYTNISGQFSTIGDGTQYAQLGPIIDFPALPLFEIAHSLAYEFDDKMCKIAQKVAERSELGLTAFERLVSDALNQSDSELVRSTDGRATIGYSFDVSVFAAYILGGHGSIGVWGDNGNYGYTVTAGPSAGIGGSLSLGASPSINYDDATHGVRVAAGAAVGLLGGEIGAGTQFSNIEANIGVGTPTAYASFQYVYVGTCND